jgi:hypothetical protein
VEVDVREDLEVGQEVHLGAALLGLPVTLSGETSNPLRISSTRSCGTPWRNSMKWTLPPWRTVRRSHFERPLTQETPTPCRPPETL